MCTFCARGFGSAHRANRKVGQKLSALLWVLNITYWILVFANSLDQDTEDPIRILKREDSFY
jgi:hypothetical protein